MTWQEAYEQTQEIAGDSSSVALIQLKRDLNLGAKRFNGALNRYFTRRAKSTDITEDQQYYQLPPDSLRLLKVRAAQSSTGTVKYPVSQVRSEAEWDALNTVRQSGNWASFYFVRGADEVGIWPIPSSTIPNGLEVAYEAREMDLTQDDYTTGTVTVTNGSTVLTGAGTTFTEAMIGRTFKIADGTDGYTYKITGYTSGTVLALEEPYIGQSGSGKTFKIGESFIFPEEYHDAPIDFALARYFEQRDQKERASYHLARYNETLDEARARYASSSQSAIITDRTEAINWWLIPPEPVTT